MTSSHGVIEALSWVVTASEYVIFELWVHRTSIGTPTFDLNQHCSGYGQLEYLDAEIAQPQLMCLTCNGSGIALGEAPFEICERSVIFHSRRNEGTPAVS